MKTKLIIFLIALVGLFGNAYAADDLEYILSTDKIKNVTVGKANDGQFNVYVTLTKVERAGFAKMTLKNVGKTLRVFHNDKLLVKAIIKDEIDSGIIVIGNFHTAAEAAECVKTLLSD